MKDTKKKQKKFDTTWDAVLPRVEYLCALLFGGNTKAFARRVNMPHRALKKALVRKYGTRLSLVVKLVRSGLVNAEWLLVGTGPVRPQDTALPVELAPPAETQFPLLDTQQVQYFLPEAVQFSLPETERAVSPAAVTKPDKTALKIARLVYEARKNDKPVILFLNAAAVTENIGTVVVSMMQKGYVTGVALSSDAAERDLERALLGGWIAATKRIELFNTLLSAASIAACNGLGWGMAAGRWCFPPDSDRAASVIASAYELNLPVTIHLALGDCVSHLFPSRDVAVRGAELGAASYLDLLVFAEQARKFAAPPVPGLYLNTGNDQQGFKLIKNAVDAITGAMSVELPATAIANISGEYRHSFPALLAACDAVYDGTADDGR